MIKTPILEKCKKCKNKLYGYTDGVYNIMVCWACGAYYVNPPIQNEFTLMLQMNPLIILELIENKTFVKA